MTAQKRTEQDNRVGGRDMGRKTMAMAKLDPCAIFSELNNSDGAIVFHGLVGGTISDLQVKGLNSAGGKPLIFYLHLHLSTYPDWPEKIMEKLDLAAVDKDRNNFLHELSTNKNPSALGMIKHIPEEIRNALLIQTNNRGVTPLALAKAVENTAFLAAVNPKA